MKNMYSLIQQTFAEILQFCVRTGVTQMKKWYQPSRKFRDQWTQQACTHKRPRWLYLVKKLIILWPSRRQSVQRVGDGSQNAAISREECGQANKGNQRNKITMSDGNSIKRSCHKLIPAVLLKLYKEYCCITKLMPRHRRERETERVSMESQKIRSTES